MLAWCGHRYRCRFGCGVDEYAGVDTGLGVDTGTGVDAIATTLVGTGVDDP